MRGVLYAAVGARFVEAARHSASSLAGTGIPHRIVVGEGDGYRHKIRALLDSPFSHTLFLDCDTWVTGDIAPLFELLERFDVAAAHAPIRSMFDLDDVPDSYPEFNTGVLALRRSPGTRALLQDWLSEYDALLPLDPPSKDQPAFRRAAYLSGLRIATLTPEWNQRFALDGYQNQAARILHGWAAPADYERIAALMQTPGRRWDSQVFSAGRIFRDGELVHSFDQPMGRIRRIRAVVFRYL